MNYKRFSMRGKQFALLLFISILSFNAQAQKKHQFKEGLYLEAAYTYGREALYTDHLLWQIYNSKLSTPKAGQAWNQSASAPSWTAAMADSNGFFRPQRGASSGNLLQPNNPPGPGRIEARSAVPRSITQRFRGPRPSYLYLSYQSAKAQDVLLNVRGNDAALVNGTLHMGDANRMGWLNIPIKLKKGLNEFYLRGTNLAAELSFPEKQISLSTDDLTLADVVAGKDNSNLLIGLVVVNNSDKNLGNLQLKTVTAGREVITNLPSILSQSTRKVAVRIDGSAVKQKGDAASQLTLLQNGKALDATQIALRSVAKNETYRMTFISAVDSSVQYYAVNPSSEGEKPGDALLFSVHSAGVEAFGKAQAYAHKDWGNLVAPTNRRPRGFNWEDWGRIDALEVLALAKQTLQPDTQRIYLTGHSMGGHGTWFLGATYPDKWAAIAPAAGYASLKGYGSADGLIPEKGRNALEDLLLRSGNQSDVKAYATNYKQLGVYVLHGDADRTVPVEYAREMRDVLGTFHPDFAYYEYPGGSHWYSNESVDWKPLFDYFKWHKRKVSQDVDHVDFKTSNPGISASYYWATVYQQIEALKYSHIVLDRDLAKNTIIGYTDNVATLRFDLSDFEQGATVQLTIDSASNISYNYSSADHPYIYLRKVADAWEISDSPALAEKGPHRSGTFKEAFNNNMVYVYGTKGTTEENKWALEKARYDAQAWYYRGNGAFTIIADRDFKEQDYADRNIIIIGNATTNSAWNILLKDAPIQVERGTIRIGSKTYNSTELGGYFYWPKANSDKLSIGVITGSGIKGMNAATANQYFAGASGFPDYMIFSLDMLKDGATGIVDAGFYSNSWKISK